MTDAELLRKAQAGDPSACTALYQRYLPTVWRFAYARCRGDVHGAEDAVAETFLAFVRKLSTLDPQQGNLAPWLIAVLRHKLGDRRRSQRPQRATVPLETAGDGPTCCSVSPMEALERRELIAEVMDRLADDERLVLEWKYLEGHSVREISARLGRTPKGVEALLFRARRSFKTLSERFGGTDVCPRKS